MPSCRRATCDSLLHLLIVSQKDSGVTFRVGQEDGIAATTTAIKYMYGIEFPGTPDRERSLHALSCVGAFAETVEVAGLSGTVIAYAHRELAECLSDDDKLKGFLGVAAVWTQASTTRSGCLAFAVRILGQNLAAIRTKAVFQKLLGEVPKLAIALLNLVAEEKSELEGKQQKIEDSE
jgi:hypothetical protein